MDRRMVLTICSGDEHSEAFARMAKEQHPSIIVSKVRGGGTPELRSDLGYVVYQSNQAILDFLHKELGPKPAA